MPLRARFGRLFQSAFQEKRGQLRLGPPSVKQVIEVLIDHFQVVPFGVEHLRPSGPLLFEAFSVQPL